MTSHLHKILHLEISVADAMDLAIQAVQAIPAVITQVDGTHTLTAKTQLTQKPRGENIQVQIVAVGEGDGQCQVRIDSELASTLPQSQPDWGVNAHNIEMFEKAMQQGMSKWKKAHEGSPVTSAAARESDGSESLLCRACGAKLTYQTEVGAWQCESCGIKYKLLAVEAAG